MRQGDFVTRISYGGDVVFKIERIEHLKAILRGVDYRLLADAPLSDLTKTNPTETLDHPRSSSPEFRESLRRLAVSQVQLQEKNQLAINHKQKFNPIIIVISKCREEYFIWMAIRVIYAKVCSSMANCACQQKVFSFLRCKWRRHCKDCFLNINRTLSSSQVMMVF